MKSHCALLTNNCFEIVVNLNVLHPFLGNYTITCSDFGLWLLTTIANVASPQNWSILLSCVFAFSWVESSYRLEIMTCSPFSNIGYGYPSTSSTLVNAQHGNLGI
ncbi:hypothetical protein Pelo_4531 [Pelomyxa schiedti]|nr:hypothetical protein Pelo_4531 [Pelomyxa schiedti]